MVVETVILAGGGEMKLGSEGCQMVARGRPNLYMCNGTVPDIRWMYPNESMLVPLLIPRIK